MVLRHGDRIAWNAEMLASRADRQFAYPSHIAYHSVHHRPNITALRLWIERHGIGSVAFGPTFLILKFLGDIQSASLHVASGCKRGDNDRTYLSGKNGGNSLFAAKETVKPYIPQVRPLVSNGTGVRRSPLRCDRARRVPRAAQRQIYISPRTAVASGCHVRGSELKIALLHLGRWPEGGGGPGKACTQSRIGAFLQQRGRLSTMFDDLLKLFRNSPRWANSPLARRLGFSAELSYEEDDQGECELRAAVASR